MFDKRHSEVKYYALKTIPPTPTLPEGEIGYFERSWDDRLWLFHRQWEPSVSTNPIATLMIIHGTVDHSGVYAEIGKVLSDAGIAVFASDMRGWGLSDGEDLYVDDIATFVADIDYSYKRIHSSSRYSDVKARFILGKSIGGLVAAFAALEHESHFSGLLGLSGGYQIDPKIGIPPPIVCQALKYLNEYLPKFPIKPLFDSSLIVSDAAALEEWKADPLVSRGKIRLGYAVNMMQLNNSLPSLVCKLRLPMLMMIGTSDNVVTRAGHEMMVGQSSSNDAQLKLYEGGFHNLLAEPHLKHLVMRDICSWILEHTSF